MATQTVHHEPWMAIQRARAYERYFELGQRGLPIPPVAFRVDELSVLDPIEPGYSVRAPATPVLPTGAVEAVPDDAPYTNEQASVVVADSDRIDLDTVEHERQSRLIRWQRQP